MTLLKLKNGQKARVGTIMPSAVSYDRLLELGFIEGEPVTLIRKAPLGGPIQISIRNTSYALSREEAQHITVI